MKLELASAKAVKHACLFYHYAKAVPSARVSFSVFNQNGEWCGVVIFGGGANNNLAKSIGFPQGAALELVRVALNGKQESTGKAVSLSLRLLKKYAPLCKVVISFADPEQGHLGVLYQATNWIYIGTSTAQREVFHPITGKAIHKRTANALFGTIKGLRKTPIYWKHKYVFGLSNQEKERLSKIGKPYPKCVQSIDGDVPDNQLGDGGSSPT
jgi:hypothetical protein